MKGFKKLLPLMAMAVVMTIGLVLSGCAGGSIPKGEEVADKAAWAKAFADSAAEFNKSDSKITVKGTSKSDSSINTDDNKGSSSGSGSTTRVKDGQKYKLSDTYYAYDAEAGGYQIYRQDKDGNYKKESYTTSNVSFNLNLPYSFDASEETFEYFEFKGGKYILKTDKINAFLGYDGEEKKWTDEYKTYELEISIKGGKVIGIKTKETDDRNGMKTSYENTYEYIYGEGTVTLPSVS
jgi:hypothetical protein